MIRFALISIVSLFWLACSPSVAEVTDTEMKAMIVELYEIEKKLSPLDDEKTTVLLQRRHEVVQRFAEIGKSVIPVLLEALNDTTRYGFVRRTAAEAIGKINDPDSIASLHEMLRNGNNSQRQGAAESLGRLKSSQSVKPLTEALGNDPYNGVRMLSASALGEIGDTSAIEPLAKCLSNRKEETTARAYAARALADLEATTKILLVLTVLEEEHEKSPGGFLAVSCEMALRWITEAKIAYYDSTHIRNEERTKAVKEWRQWWETTGKSKYPQN